MKRVVPLALVASLGLVVAAPAASGAQPAKAHAAKKCKKGGAAVAKRCKRKKRKPATTPVSPPATPSTPAPLPLTAAEVVNRVVQKAGDYCVIDPDCVDYGYYYDTAPGDPFCDSKSTYTWACYGWNDEDDGVDMFTCDFREIVSRTGYSGITSQQDLSFAGDGWDCF